MHVPCAEVLWDFWEEENGDFRAAFVRWADELTSRYDTAIYEGRWRSAPDRTADADAVAHALRQIGSKQLLMLGDVLRPLYTRGVSIRSIAEQNNLELRQVVGALFNSVCMPNAEKYAAMDETIIAAMGSTIDLPYAVFIRNMGLPRGRSLSMERMCEVHGVPIPKAETTSPLREEAIALMAEGLTPKATIHELRNRHPDNPWVDRLNRGTLSQWKRRGLVTSA